MRYLDPRADLTFKKVFGEHPDLVISFLNALLPLDEEHLITSIEYIPIRLTPDFPLKRYSVLCLNCADRYGSKFYVDIQIMWSFEYQFGVSFNASKAYVRQLDKREDYELLQPVYSLNLVNEIFEPKLKEYYHQYDVAEVGHPEKVIEGFHLIFIELPKFKPHSFSDKKMQVLWLRYLTEMGGSQKVPQELLDNPEVKKAVDILEESSYTPAQLEGYDKFWDIVRTEKTYYNSARKHGFADGKAKGLAEGRVEGAQENNRKNAKSMKGLVLPIDTIKKVTGLTEEEIEEL